MKNKHHQKIKFLTIMLPVIFLLQACTSTNQNDIAELNVKTSPVVIELQSVEEIEEQRSSEIQIAEEFINIDMQPEESEVDQDHKFTGSTADLTEDEIASLIFMREEEKLAKDVYLGLFDLWGTPIFQNIANSEQTHTDAVKRLLDTFGIKDPADNSPVGVFANEDLQNLYDELMVIGAQSLGDALKVGGAIEEIDILDLKESLEIIQNDEIQRVYENLLRGSENHLRAFTSNFERQTGETYQPQYLTQSDYDAILSNATSRGRRGNSNRP